MPADAPLAGVLRNPRVREGLTRLAAEGGSSTYAARALLIAEPLSIDASEITDKGYINQRAVLARRSALVETLSADTTGDVIRIDKPAVR